MKVVPRDKVVFSFSAKHEPVEHVQPGELVLFETEDAFQGQIRDESTSLKKLDWSKVNGVTGPVYVDGAEPGDTLVVEILDVKVGEKGVIVTVPKSGILGTKRFKRATKIVEVSRGYVHFDRDVRVKTNPMIGTVGVAPGSIDVPSGSLGKHGGNMDVKDLTAGTRLYLQVFTDGALFAAGDVHAVQADGELCVSSAETAAEVLLRFNLIKNKKPEWPILETRDSFAILTCGESLDEAAVFASDAAVKALAREYNWPFEKAYMLGSLAVNLEINQAVDPRRGVRAVVSKEFMALDALLT